MWAQWGPPVRKVLRELQGRLARQVLLEQRVRLGRRGRRVLPVQLVRKVPLGVQHGQRFHLIQHSPQMVDMPFYRDIQR